MQQRPVVVVVAARSPGERRERRRRDERRPLGRRKDDVDDAAPGTLPTASKSGEAFFAKELQPLLMNTCGGCHVAGGQGNPTWIDANDAKKTYDMIYLQAYATATSRIVVKGPHANGGAPALTNEERSKWGQWIALEAKEPGKPAQASVLEKFGDCFDKAKFDAIGFGDLQVIGRTPKNNPQRLDEDQETCTGCRDNTKCNTCHSSDDATGFVMAIGNDIFPEDYTFESTKKLSPPFIREYVGTTPAGGTPCVSRVLPQMAAMPQGVAHANEKERGAVERAGFGVGGERAHGGYLRRRARGRRVVVAVVEDGAREASA